MVYLEFKTFQIFLKVILIEASKNVFSFDITLLQEHFWSLDETEIRTSPKLITQIWDNDSFSADDFLGKHCCCHKLLTNQYCSRKSIVI